VLSARSGPSVVLTGLPASVVRFGCAAIGFGASGTAGHDGPIRKVTLRCALAAAVALATGVLLSSPAAVTAATPVKGGRYVGIDRSGVRVAIQVSKSGHSLSARHGGSYVDWCTQRRRLRLVSRRMHVLIRPGGAFSFVRRHGSALRLRGRFRSKDSALVRVSLRCGGSRVQAVFTLHRIRKPPFSGCRSQLAKTVASSPSARIFTQSRVVGFEYFPSTYGCLYSVNKRFELVSDADFHEGQGAFLSFFRLADDYVGFVVGPAEDCEGDCFYDLRVIDLQSGRRLRQVRLEQDVWGLELSDNGSLGWGAFGDQNDEIWADDHHGRRLLDASPITYSPPTYMQVSEINHDSLALTSSTLSWIKAGVRRYAALY
jgi:hypothetical protein